jgi:hypothetical protein
MLCAGIGVAVFGLIPVRAAGLTTQDGLALRLDDTTGTVEAVAVNGRDLPLLQGVHGGLSYREWRYRERATAATVASTGFETTDGWQPVVSANWQPGEEVAAEVRTDGGAQGSRSYVRLGAARKYGHGAGFAKALPVVAGGTYSICWQARVPSAAETYILYLRLYDVDGRDITTESPAPKGWSYSPFTQTHFDYLIGVPDAGTWVPVRRAYRVPDGAAALRLALCLWRGEYVDADCLELKEAPGAMPCEPVAVVSPLSHRDGDQVCSQQVTVPGEQLEFQVAYRPAADHIQIEVCLRDTSQPGRDRAVEVRYALPIRLDGWSWHDDARRQRRIEGPATYANDFSYEGHAVSRYPFSCVSSGAAGLALAVRPDVPLMEHRTCRAGTGLGLAADLGLSPLGGASGLGQTTFTFVLYAMDPGWGFRAAAARYYDLFPDAFRERTPRQGCWLWPVAPDEVPQPDDFGLTFWESSSATPATRDFARRQGISVLHYIEPCGLRQWFPELKAGPTMYTFAECLARLKALAADTNSTAKWAGGPQWHVARAVLNSLPALADGAAPFLASKQYGDWAQWWFTNPSPHLPEPNRGTTCHAYEIAPVLPDVDGVYVDSVGLETVHYENYRPEHLASARTPLTFSFETGRACQPGALALHDFLQAMATDLHAQGKLVMTNIGAEPPAYRFYAHLADVLGCEVGSGGDVKRRDLAQVETDAVSCLRRTYAYRRPTTNLLQEGNYTTPVPALGRTEVEQYIKHQLFYGFYPGISTIGGEEKPGYSGWKRYFRSPEQIERDRDLFRKLIPVIRRLNAAGWEPVTGASPSVPEVAIERFGRWATGDLQFTLRNLTPEPRAVTVRVDLSVVGADAAAAGQAVVVDVLAGQRLATSETGAADTFAFDTALGARDTLVVSVGPTPRP